MLRTYLVCSTATHFCPKERKNAEKKVVSVQAKEKPIKGALRARYEGRRAKVKLGKSGRVFKIEGLKPNPPSRIVCLPRESATMDFFL